MQKERRPRVDAAEIEALHGMHLLPAAAGCAVALRDRVLPGGQLGEAEATAELTAQPRRCPRAEPTARPTAEPMAEPMPDAAAA